MPDFSASLDVSSLNLSTGFTITSEESYDDFGQSVASVGDFNGDGIDDIIVGALRGDAQGYDGAGVSYLIFGKAGGFSSNLDLSNLTSSDGFRISGEAITDRSGVSVAAAGDINGDGFADVIVGANQADPNGINSGASYVIFGGSGSFSDLKLSSLDGSNGFKINGVAASDGSGQSVSAAGDLNGDGVDDLIIGAPYSESLQGTAYVVFGSQSGFADELDLSDLDGTNGFNVVGEATYDSLGSSIALIGDINGDGIDDIVLGAAGHPYNTVNGSAYVIFGKNTAFAQDFDVSTLNGTNGFKITGETLRDFFGKSVSSAGDVNGDGINDLIVGASYEDQNGSAAGSSYVILGKDTSFGATLDLATLNGTNGFQINGANATDFFGGSVSSAGDVNGDGFDDLIIGASNANPNNVATGAAYVLFGKATGFDQDIELTSLNGSTGFRINGTNNGDRFGYSVSSAGDINNDGFDDLLVGTLLSGSSDLTKTYIIYGRAPTEAVTRDGTSTDNTIRGGKFNDTLNGLGGDDELFGNGGKDKLNGGNGKDKMHGGAGDDIYIIDNSGDKVFETSGKDEIRSANQSLNLKNAKYDGVENAKLTGSSNKDLTGDNSKNKLTGNDGKNTLKGEGGKDTLNGGDGKDKLYGGKADDMLTGGNGKDTFIFKKNEGNDTITDFENGKDKIDLSAFNFANKSAALAKFYELGNDHNDKLGFNHKGTEIVVKGIDMGDLNGADIII